MNDSDPYCYPGTSVLLNRLAIRDTETLEIVEREFVAQRISEGVPPGAFDLKHLCAIHRHLFQDLYDWAGELRSVEMTKGGDSFQFRRFIETGMADIHRRLVAADFLTGLNAHDFARAAAEILGDVNYVHPFRDGNGRTQLQYLKALTETAGHICDLTRLDAELWIKASRAAHRGDYAPMSAEILATLAL